MMLSENVAKLHYFDLLLTDYLTKVCDLHKVTKQNSVFPQYFINLQVFESAWYGTILQSSIYFLPKIKVTVFYGTANGENVLTHVNQRLK